MGEKFDPYEGEIDDILDFQTGGKEDERQYITIVEIEDGNLTLSAYQRTEAGDSYSSLCKDYSVIDSVNLVKKGGSVNVLPIVIVVIVVVIIIAVILAKKKKQSK